MIADFLLINGLFHKVCLQYSETFRVLRRQSGLDMVKVFSVIFLSAVEIV